MNRLPWFLLSVGSLLLLLLLAAGPTTAQSDVIINNADASWTSGLSRSNTLASIVSQVVARVVQDSADANRNDALVNAPTSLRTLLGGVPARVTFDSADASRIVDLAQLPDAMRTVVAATAARVVINMANGTRIQALSYPTALVGDRTPPSMAPPALEAGPVGAIDLVWATDEFTTVIVKYRTAPGSYANEKVDTLFAKSHRLRFTDLQPGVTYYFKFVNTDRSGNTAESEEFVLTLDTTQYLYLPALRR